jgi:hypothetical protein
MFQVTVLVGEMSGSHGCVYEFTVFWDVARDEQMINVLRIIEIIEANWIQM